LRIAILSRDFPPKIGGVGDHTDILARELSARGHQVHAVTLQPAEHRQSFVVHACSAWDLDAGWSRDVSAALDAIAPDVVLWQYNPFSIGRRGVPLNAGRLTRALARRARLVVHFHEQWFPWGRGGARGLVWALTQRAAARAVVRAAHASIATTEPRAEALKRMGARSVARIPVGANFPVPDVSKADARASLGIAPEAFVLAHLGGTGHGHEMRPVLDALRIARARGVAVELLLVGKGSETLAGREFVRTTGTLPHAEVGRALRAADAYIHPDPSGPAPGRRGALVAALSQALPLIAFRGPEQAPQLTDANMLLVEPTAQAVAEAVERLARDPGLSARLAAAIRETHETEFSWGRIAERVERVCADR
jgi:glycosyltransferase involved in cell wall biosynthesis